ncbi:hypothetical protein [Nocardioides humi]|uniref:DUF3558 domain-containing protein n=1 Tax=Nocardioides humi TaxID=449461 RepID=A0ABN2AMD5_9ACTN|nr:hypothetical protein [Nocardioides humi]
MRNITLNVLASTALALVLTACGDDEGSPDAAEASAGASLGDAQVKAITAAEICDNLTPDEVSDAIGLEATSARADDDATPQCLYDLTGSDGALVGLVVAGMRPESEVGGKTGDAAFDYVLDLNRSYAGESGLEESTVAAGDRATHLKGASLHFGLVATGGHLITVALPVADADDAAFEALLAAVGSELG